MARSHSVTLAATIVALSACGSSTAPATRALTLAVGDSVEGSVTGADSVVYRLRVAPHQAFAVHLWPLDEGLTGAVIDSMNFDRADLFTSTTGGQYTQWSTVVSEAGGPYRIWIIPEQQTNGGRFGLRVHGIPRAPESIPATIQIGDTISGERLEDADDMDEFTVDVASALTVQLHLQASVASIGPPHALLFQTSGGVPTGNAIAETTASAPTDALSTNASAAVLLEPGRYLVRVWNPSVSTRFAYAGGYRFTVSPVAAAASR